MSLDHVAVGVSREAGRLIIGSGSSSLMQLMGQNGPRVQTTNQFVHGSTCARDFTVWQEGPETMLANKDNSSSGLYVQLTVRIHLTIQ